MSTLITVSGARLPGELLDRIDLVVCNTVLEKLVQISRESTYHLLCLYA
jgi:hypothetical protein